MLEQFPPHGWWLIVGFVLILSEFLLPGVIAVFFGLGAVAVGLLAWLGVLDSFSAQLWAFPLLSLLALFTLRRRFTVWLKGNVSQKGTGASFQVESLGEPVKVLQAFDNGRGVVQLRGARWDALCESPLAVGDTAWVVGNHGIVLKVSAERGTN